MPTKSFDEALLEELRDPELAAEYLSAAAEASSASSFLDCLKQVTRAHGGVDIIAEVADMNAQRLAQALSESGTLSLEDLFRLLSALGLSMHFLPLERNNA